MNKVKTKLIIYCGLLFILGCAGGENNPFNKSRNAMKHVSETADDGKRVSDSQSTMQASINRMEELKNLIPASREEFKTWLPESVDGYTRTSFSTGDQGLGAVSAISGSYSSDENKTFELNVVDGAGEAGGVFALVYLLQLNRDFEEEYAEGFFRSMKKDNRKVIVSQDDRYNTSDLEFLEGQRYYVQMFGNNMNVDELWQVASKLGTQKLPGL